MTDINVRRRKDRFVTDLAEEALQSLGVCQDEVIDVTLRFTPEFR